MSCILTVRWHLLLIYDVLFTYNACWGLSMFNIKNIKRISQRSIILTLEIRPAKWIFQKESCNYQRLTINQCSLQTALTKLPAIHQSFTNKNLSTYIFSFASICILSIFQGFLCDLKRPKFSRTIKAISTKPLRPPWGKVRDSLESHSAFDANWTLIYHDMTYGDEASMVHLVMRPQWYTWRSGLNSTTGDQASMVHLVMKPQWYAWWWNLNGTSGDEASYVIQNSIVPRKLHVFNWLF